MADTPRSESLPLRVAIADDHRLMLDGIRRALETAPDIVVVGEAMSGAAMLKVVNETTPDVAILDLRMPDGDGLETLSTIRAQYPDLKVIILSMFEDREHIDEALRRGADGYVVKSINPLDLPSTVRQVVEGTVYHPRTSDLDDQPSADAPMPLGGESATADTPKRARKQTNRKELTQRELAILRLVAEGLSNLDIASELYVTEQTVKFHLSNIYRKLVVANRTEATRYAYRHGLID